MKTFLFTLVLFTLTLSGATQFVSMPLNYPQDTSAYLSYWTSIVDQNTVWVGTARQRNHGYIAYSTAIKTDDGGNTWEFYPIPVPGNPWIQHLSAWDSSVCYYLFTDGTVGGGSVWKTNNGGLSWSAMTTTQFAGGWANVIHCFSADTVMVMGDPTQGYFEIQITYDGGNTWFRVPATDIPPALTGETGTSGEFCSIGNCIWFPTSKGRCFRSSDRGLHWNVASVTDGYIRISFTDSLNGISFLPGTLTGFYSTSDGGATWTHQTSNNPFKFGTISNIPGIANGYAATTHDTANTSILFTHDGFITYTKIDSNVRNSSFINFKDPSTGWLGGSYNPNNNIHKFIGLLSSIGEKNNNATLLHVYPNPCSGAAFIKIPAGFEKRIILRVIDISGATVSERPVELLSEGIIKLDGSLYDNGIYLIEINSENATCRSAPWFIRH